MDIIWKDLPDSKRGTNASKELADLAEQLKSRPGDWALIRKDVKPQSAINLRTAVAFRDGGYEFVTRNNTHDIETGKRCDVYGRYVGH